MGAYIHICQPFKNIFDFIYVYVVAAVMSCGGVECRKICKIEKKSSKITDHGTNSTITV